MGGVRSGGGYHWGGRGGVWGSGDRAHIYSVCVYTYSVYMYVYTYIVYIYIHIYIYCIYIYTYIHIACIYIAHIIYYIVFYIFVYSVYLYTHIVTYTHMYTHMYNGITQDLTPQKPSLDGWCRKGKKNKAFGARATYILVVSTHQINAPKKQVSSFIWIRTSEDLTMRASLCAAPLRPLLRACASYIQARWQKRIPAGSFCSDLQNCT